MRNSCPLGWLFVLIVVCLSVIFIISRFGVKSGIWFLIAPVPSHCFSITFITSPKLSDRQNASITPQMNVFNQVYIPVFVIFLRKDMGCDCVSFYAVIDYKITLHNVQTK